MLSCMPYCTEAQLRWKIYLFMIYAPLFAASAAILFRVNFLVISHISGLPCFNKLGVTLVSMFVDVITVDEGWGASATLFIAPHRQSCTHSPYLLKHRKEGYRA